LFDLSIPKLLVLAVIALVIFGPHELPKIASQAGRAEFADFDIEDLNPKRFVQKHLFDDLNGGSDHMTASAAAAADPSPSARANGTLLAPGERPPFDPDAT